MVAIVIGKANSLRRRTAKHELAIKVHELAGGGLPNEG
jgi:hypothetical protein